MILTRVCAPALVLALVTAAPVRAAGQDAIELVIKAGRPLQVALDQRLAVKRVGQPVTGTLVEPVYAYDRLVVPAGTKVRGHVQRLTNPGKAARLQAMLGGDFSPHRQIVLTFDTLMFGDGREIPIQTLVTGGLAHVTRQVAGAATESKKTGKVARAKDEVEQRTREAIAAARQKASDTMAAITQPGKMERLKDAAIQRLPYHPQFLNKGTVYAADLTAPVPFGPGTPTASAPSGTAPAPASVLTARLVTPLDSAKTPRGTVVEAVVTEPVFSADHHLILPEGTTLTGEVTFAAQPRRFRRNGQFRFLFEQVHALDQESAQLLASLYSVQASADDNVVIDDEGGASVTNPKTRFIAPVLAALALRGAIGRGRHVDNDGDANDVAGAPATGGVGSRGLGGFLGFGAIGAVVSQFSPPVAIAVGAVGVARTVYTNVLGKGPDVSFPADTPIQVRLAPGPTPRQ